MKKFLKQKLKQQKNPYSRLSIIILLKIFIIKFCFLSSHKQKANRDDKHFMTDIIK